MSTLADLVPALQRLAVAGYRLPSEQSLVRSMALSAAITARRAAHDAPRCDVHLDPDQVVVVHTREARR